MKLTPKEGLTFPVRPCSEMTALQPHGTVAALEVDVAVTVVVVAPEVPVEGLVAPVVDVPADQTVDASKAETANQLRFS